MSTIGFARTAPTNEWLASRLADLIAEAGTDSTTPMAVWTELLVRYGVLVEGWDEVHVARLVADNIGVRLEDGVIHRTEYQVCGTGMTAIAVFSTDEERPNCDRLLFEGVELTCGVVLVALVGAEGYDGIPVLSFETYEDFQEALFDVLSEHTDADVEKLVVLRGAPTKQSPGLPPVGEGGG